MFDLLIGLIIVFSIGTCTLRDSCTPNKDNKGKVYKFCSEVFIDKKE